LKSRIVIFQAQALDTRSALWDNLRRSFNAAGSWMPH
jgi:hypothetical protein